MKRIVVAGARGFFGSTIVDLLRRDGAVPLAASRRTGSHLQLDVENRASIRASLAAGDVIVDATAPFQARTTTLIEEAVAIGFDLVDLCDSLAYARRVVAFNEPARTRGIRLAHCCSSVSVLSALAVTHSGIAEPDRVHGLLAPAARQTANRGAAEAFLSSVGRPIDVWRDGAWQRARGWGESREFPAIGRHARLVEMADSLTLPRAFPSLRTVDFWVDPNTRGAGPVLALGSRVRVVLPLMPMVLRYGAPVVRMLGRGSGVLAYMVEDRDRRRATVIFRGRDSFLMAAIPAAVAARRLAQHEVDPIGLIPVNQQIPRESLLAAFEMHGIEMRVA